ncbi:hypothetical protein L7F22_055057 [Adiantum nelumboides]|nr:hypothetical protein [Adiantum nelumboides]
MDNGTLRVLVVENEHLKKVLEMQTTCLMQLKNEVQECKHSFVEINALKECLSKVENDYALKEEKMDTMRRDVSEMKDVSKSWADKTHKIQNLENQLADQRHLDTKKAEDFIKRIKNLQDQLAVVGVVTTPEDLARRYIRILPPKYDGLVTALNTQVVIQHLVQT